MLLLNCLLDGEAYDGFISKLRKKLSSRSLVLLTDFTTFKVVTLDICDTRETRRIKMYISRLLFVCLSVLLTACGVLKPKDVAEPSTLTVEDAMASIGRGFYRMHQELEGINTNTNINSDHKNADQWKNSADRVKLGLWPCKVTTTLNVTANATENRNLVLDLTVKPPVEVVDASLTGKADKINTSMGNRANSITIELYSAACIPEKTLGYTSPEKVIDVVKGLTEGQDTSTFSKPPSVRE